MEFPFWKKITLISTRLIKKNLENNCMKNSSVHSLNMITKRMPSIYVKNSANKKDLQVNLKKLIIMTTAQPLTPSASK